MSIGGVAGIVGGSVELYHAIEAATHVAGRRAAGTALFTIFALSLNAKELFPEAFESRAQFKAKLLTIYSFSDSNMLITYTRFLLYKYKPTMFQEIKTLALKFLPALLSISAGIMTILAASSVASFGIVPGAIGITASAITVALMGYKMGKHIQSHLAYKKLLKDGIIDPQDDVELKNLLGKTVRTRIFKLTMGDWFRYKIAELLSQAEYLDQEPKFSDDIMPISASKPILIKRGAGKLRRLQETRPYEALKLQLDTYKVNVMTEHILENSRLSQFYAETKKDQETFLQIVLQGF